MTYACLRVVTDEAVRGDATVDPRDDAPDLFNGCRNHRKSRSQEGKTTPDHSLILLSLSIYVRILSVYIYV